MWGAAGHLGFRKNNGGSRCMTLNIKRSENKYNIKGMLWIRKKILGKSIRNTMYFYLSI